MIKLLIKENIVLWLLGGEASEIGTLRNFSLVTAGGRESGDSLFGSKHCYTSICPIFFLSDYYQIWIQCKIMLDCICGNCQGSDWEGKIEDLKKCTEKWFWLQWLGNRCNPTLDWDLNKDLNFDLNFPKKNRKKKLRIDFDWEMILIAVIGESV